MAVVYFTSNASTGAGSLAEAVKNASPGDVIRPDETVFERGSTIEIVLASRLRVDKDLTFDASPFRAVLDGGSAVGDVLILNGVVAEFTSFDFVRGKSDSGAGAYVLDNATATFNRCLFAGCDAVYGGAINGGNGTTIALNDCAVVGCRGVESGGGVLSSGVLNLNGVTAVGCVSGRVSDVSIYADGVLTASNSILGVVVKSSTTRPTFAGSVVDVAPSTVGFVASPPDDLTPENWNANAWRDWDLRLLDDASGAPSPYRDSGDVDAMSRYDLDGNFRGRETNGVATCSPGAYETIQADLFWIGRDATGAEVVSPSFLTSDGWAASRFATVSGDVAPQTEQTLFIGRDVAFVDAPPDGSALNVGGSAEVSTGGGAGDSTISLGVGATFDVATAISAARLADESLVKLRAGSLTVDGRTATPDATEPLRFVRWTGGRLRVVDYLLLLKDLAIPPNGTLDLDGATLRVRSLTVGDGATVGFSSPNAETLGNDANNATAGVNVDAVLSVSERANVGAASFTGAGYFATPPGTDTTSAVFAETVCSCDYGANVSSFSASSSTATSAHLSWVKQNPIPSVLIEEANGNGWNVVNNRVTGDSLSVDISSPKIFRLFDGENFFTVSARPYGTAYELAEEQTVGYLKTLISTGYLN